MFREIADLAQKSDYDFRATACPDDPFRYLFDEWAPYYRAKWAIARCLRPARILEIGVRYGYSALAFLNACPSAHYTGIDPDSNSMEWARKHAAGCGAEFIVADSQSFDEFPGGPYDLIHIDGRRDQKGLFHDLDLAIRQARRVLVDGCFRTREDCLSAAEFLFRNRDLIDFHGVIPGAGGDLLIVPKQSHEIRAGQAESSGQIRHAYTSSYYLGDCGGFDSFKRTQGLKLEDSRLRTMAQLATLAHPGRALDLGCGRGELSIALAQQGFDVTGIDYSSDAIALAESAKNAAAGQSLKISFVCGDLASAPMEGKYEVAVAADVIEHLSPAELDQLYRRIADHLAPDGLFVIHTFPNAWYYKYEHARRLKIARSIGAYLPENPRSRYEQLMHINEQSPRVLRRQLRRYFPHVLLWFSDHDVLNPYENLRRKFSIREMAQSGDLFAIASNRPLKAADLGRYFEMKPEWSLAKDDIAIRVLRSPSSVEAGQTFKVEVLVKNRSAADLKSFPPHPVHLCYHWVDAATSAMVVFDGERTLLEPALTGGSEQQYTLSVRAPSKASAYRLQATLVQEYVRWLDLPPVSAIAEIPVSVT